MQIFQRFVFFFSFFFGLKEVSSSLPGSQWERIAVMKISPQNIYYTLYAQTKNYGSAFPRQKKSGERRERGEGRREGLKEWRKGCQKHLFLLGSIRVKKIIYKNEALFFCKPPHLSPHQIVCAAFKVP